MPGAPYPPDTSSCPTSLVFRNAPGTCSNTPRSPGAVLYPSRIPQLSAGTANHPPQNSASIRPGFVAHYTDQQFAQNLPAGSQPSSIIYADSSRLRLQGPASTQYPPHSYLPSQQSQTSESLYAADSLTTCSPTSSSWTSESSLLSSQWNPSGPSFQIPPIQHRFPVPHNTNKVTNTQHIYAILKPPSNALTNDRSISRLIVPSKYGPSSLPVSNPPALPPPRQHAKISSEAGAKEQDLFVAPQVLSSHQITVTPSIFDPASKRVDQQLTVLPVNETYERLHNTSNQQISEHDYHSMDSSHPFNTNMNQTGDNRRSSNDGKSEQALGNQGNAYLGPLALGSVHRFSNSNQLQSLPQPLYLSDHHSPYTSSGPAAGQFMSYTDNVPRSSSMANPPLLCPKSVGSQQNIQSAGLTIYSPPGRPIIYPSQSSASTGLTGKSNDHNKTSQQSLLKTNLYDPNRKSSLPVLKTSPSVKQTKPADRKQTVGSKPLPVMDRKQAVYTLRNSLPPVSRNSPPIAPNRKKHVPAPSDREDISVSCSNNSSSGPIAPPRVKHDKMLAKTDGVTKQEPLRSSMRYGMYEPLLNTGVDSIDALDNVRLETNTDAHIYEAVQPRFVDNSGYHSLNLSDGALSLDNCQSVDKTLGNVYMVNSTNNVPSQSDEIYSSRSLDTFVTESGNQTSEEASNIKDIIATQDAIDRIKRNVEKKEEYSRQPSESIWPTPSVIKDYHVSPQKLSQPLWPPPCTQVPPSPGVISKALTFVANSKIAAAKRKKAKAELEARTRNAENIEDDDHGGFLSPSISNATVVTARPLVVNAVPKPFSPANETSSAKYGKSFVTNLPRIQENLPTKELGSHSSLGSLQSGSCTPSTTTPSGSQISLNSPSIRSIPMAWVGDNDRIKQLQIVSKRAKKFESQHQSGRSGAGKTALQRFELSRLSQRAKIAERKEEFERRDSQRTDSIAGKNRLFRL